jgi:hypothetical protein
MPRWRWRESANRWRDPARLPIGSRTTRTVQAGCFAAGGLATRARRRFLVASEARWTVAISLPRGCKFVLVDPVGLHRVQAISVAGPSLVVTHPKLQALHGYWRTECRANGLPARTSFGSEGMRLWLGHVALIDVLREPVQFRVRLYGTQLANLNGADLSGKALDGCFARNKVAAALDPYYACMKYSAPVAFAHRYETNEQVPLVLEQILLPCAADGVNIDLIVGAAYLESAKTPVSLNC